MAVQYSSLPFLPRGQVIPAQGNRFNVGIGNDRNMALLLAVLQFMQGQEESQARMGIETKLAETQVRSQRFEERVRAEDIEVQTATRRLSERKTKALETLEEKGRKRILREVEEGGNSARSFEKKLLRRSREYTPRKKEETRRFIASLPQEIASLMEKNPGFRSFGAAGAVLSSLETFGQRIADPEILEVLDTMKAQNLRGLTNLGPKFETILQTSLGRQGRAVDDFFTFARGQVRDAANAVRGEDLTGPEFHKAFWTKVRPLVETSFRPPELTVDVPTDLVSFEPIELGTPQERKVYHPETGRVTEEPLGPGPLGGFLDFLGVRPFVPGERTLEYGQPPPGPAGPVVPTPFGDEPMAPAIGPGGESRVIFEEPVPKRLKLRTPYYLRRPEEELAGPPLTLPWWGDPSQMVDIYPGGF